MQRSQEKEERSRSSTLRWIETMNVMKDKDDLWSYFVMKEGTPSATFQIS